MSFSPSSVSQALAAICSKAHLATPPPDAPIASNRWPDANHPDGKGDAPYRLSNSSVRLRPPVQHLVWLLIFLTQSGSGTLYNDPQQEWDDCDAGLILKAEGDSMEIPALSAILANVSLASAHPTENLTTERVEVILHHHNKAIVAYHVALEMQRVSTSILSQMRDQKDTLFGQGMWLLRNADELGEHSQTVHRAMGMRKWDEGKKGVFTCPFVSDFPSVAYQEHWRSIAETLFLSIEPPPVDDDL